MKIKYPVFTVFMALLTLLLAFPGYAKPAMTDAGTRTTAHAQQQTDQKREEILSEATAAIHQTRKALKALDDEDTKAALTALESATGKLELILARDPEMALAPASVDTVTYNVLASVDAVKLLRDEAEEALEDGRLQKARRLIRNLASETVIRTHNIPLATYPEAIKRAATRIDAGKPEEARRILQTALNTLTVTEQVIPLPLVAAEQWLHDAEKLAARGHRSDEEQEKLASLLNKVRRELAMAEALGYGTEEDFEAFDRQLERIERKTDAGGHGEGFFSKLRHRLGDTIDDLQPENLNPIH